MKTLGCFTSRSLLMLISPQPHSLLTNLPQVPNTDGYVEPGREGKPPKKTRDITLTGLGVELPVEIWTPSGWPAVSGPVLKALAGKVAIDWATPEVDEDAEGSFEPTDSDSEVGHFFLECSRVRRLGKRCKCPDLTAQVAAVL